jgi:hypothetical protein
MTWDTWHGLTVFAIGDITDLPEAAATARMKGATLRTDIYAALFTAGSLESPAAATTGGDG